ncbi:MAG TPA: TatD family hydrolase [Bacteroidales bacterium]|nr:TatD family hydrolase [Bacteroidales bacterium]HRX96960.1 TatD family hydrolase [Bacteroidales bacterium]
MIFTDTHTHLYLNAFDDDRANVVKKAVEQDVKYMLLPNIDSSSIDPMFEICKAFPENCFPMMGLHPTSVKENYKEELEIISGWFEKQNFIAIGEIGIDLYWDQSFQKQQEEAFRFQIDLALKNEIPIVIHSRDSFDEIFSVLEDYRGSGLKGVFHCFTGSLEQANKAIDLGFYLGIGGVLTFKNSGLDKVIAEIDLKHILLETDSPFLAPTPFRGKRNESAYINLVANRLSQIKNIDREEIAKITTQNAIDLFKFTDHA